MDHLLIWVLAGQGHAREGKRHAACAAGDLIVLRAGRSHAYGSNPRDPWDILWVHYSGSAADDFASRLAARCDRPPVASLGLDDQIRHRFDEMLMAHRRRDSGQLRAHTCLFALLGLMLDRLQQPRRHQPLPAFDAEATQRYIDAHLEAPLTVEQLADRAGYSPSHFARLFRAVFKVSPMRYVIEQRVARAALLLTQTAQPIHRIAKAVGYDDPLYFSRQFRQQTRQSPTAYRDARSG